MNQPVLSRTATLLALAAGLAALGGCNDKPEVLKIGVAAPLTGPNARIGQDLLNGAKLAASEINAAGGALVDGKHLKIEILPQDDKSTTEGGDAAAHAFVDAGAELAIADYNSGVTIHAAPIYAAAGIPQMSVSTNPAFTKLGLDTTLRLVASNVVQAKALGGFAAQLQGAARYAVVDDSTVYGKGLADDSAAVLSGTGKAVVLRRSVDDKTTDFAALVTDLAAAKADVLVTTLSDFQVQALMNAAGAAGLKDLSIVTGNTAKTTLLTNAPVPVKALYATTQMFGVSEFPTSQRFLQSFEDTYKAPPYFGAHYVYDAVYMTVDALSRNASLDKGKLLATLKHVDLNCPATNSLRFGEDGEQRYAAIAVYQMEQGDWRVLVRSDHW